MLRLNLKTMSSTASAAPWEREKEHSSVVPQMITVFQSSLACMVTGKT